MSTPTETPQSPRLPAARRRMQLLDVATREFATRGFHETSMNDIASAAGVTKPVLYQHFASKRDLYLELLDTAGDELLRRIGSATDVADPRRKVVKGYEAFFRFVAERQNEFQLLFGGGTQRDPEFAEAARRIETTIAEFIAPLIDVNVDEEERLLLANGLVGLAEHTNRWLIATGRPLDPETVSAQVAQLAWSGLRGIGPRGQ